VVRSAGPVAYIAPILLRADIDPASATSAVLTIPVGVFVGESVAWLAHRERRTHHRADALARVATALANRVSEESLFDSLVDEVRRALRSEHAVLYQIDPDHRVVQRVFTSGIDEPFSALLHGLEGMKVPDFEILRTLARGEPIVVEDASSQTAVQQDIVSLFRIRSYLAMPVIAREQLVGVLACGESSRARSYDADDVELALAVASQASAATQNAILFQQAQEAARKDALTELGNRRDFHERLEAEVERSRRHGRPLSLVMLDLDGLKDVNDSWGHQAGDRVLVRFADHLRRTLRTSDGAYRIGGDEFALILPETSPLGASVLAERVRRAVERARVGGDDGIRLTVSIGVGSFPEHGASPDALFARADTAMYEVKAAGGDAVAMAMHSDVRTPGMRFGVDLQRIVDARHLVPVYQPIVDLKTGRVFGYECFVHLDPRQGSAPTPTLFRAAGALGLVEVLDGLCRAVALEASGDLPTDAYLFLNVSPAVLESPSFQVTDIVEPARAAGIDPDRLVVEVIEQDRSPESSVLAANLQLCRAAGLRVALDDLGAGKADLELMARLPFDFVKVDMTFVHGAEAEETRRRLLMGLGRLVAETGAGSIAEGVETVADLQLVLDMGFGAAQGFILGHPQSGFTAPSLPDILAHH
jgi:diguanylate cyclase (GGDEF)-like protein